MFPRSLTGMGYFCLELACPEQGWLEKVTNGWESVLPSAAVLAGMAGGDVGLAVGGLKVDAFPEGEANYGCTESPYQNHEDRRDWRRQ